MKRPALLLVLFLATLFLLPAYAADAPARGNIVCILDGSGSMWGQLDNKTKIEIAQDTLAELIENLPDDVNAGLVAYGHRSEGDCNDVQTLVPLGPLNKAAMVKAVRAIKPKGKTPITESVRQTAEGLRGVEGETTILLVSDGKETCAGDPCALVRELKASGINFVMDVIGFDVTDAERQQLECMAEAGGGAYYSAKNADQFRQAVLETSKKESLAASKLHLTVTRNGQEIPALVQIKNKENGEEVVSEWTYVKLGLTKYLSPGEYEMTVTDDKAADRPSQTMDLTVEAGQQVEKTVDFSSGVIHMATTLNGQPIECFIEVYKAGTQDRVLSAFSDNSAHVAKLVLPGGSYDIEISHRKTQENPKKRLEGVQVAPGQEQDMTVAFESGVLEVSVVMDGQEMEGEVHVLDNETKSMLWFEKCAPGKPAVFKLSTGVYTLELDSVKQNGESVPMDAPQVADVPVQAGQTTHQTITVVRQ